LQLTSLEAIAINRLPSITTWSRLEPQPRDATLARSLQAQVRDPAWMLARQWQLGEFEGTDGGSPVQATMGVTTQPLTGYRPGPPGGQVQPFASPPPLEVHVEREQIQFGLRGAVQLGRYFERLVSLAAGPLPQGVTDPQGVIDAFRTAFPISSDDPDPALAGQGGLQLRALAAGRVLDGQALYTSAVTAAAGGTPSPPLPPEASDPAVAALLALFVAVRQSAFSEPSGDAAWQSAALDYAFAVESASTTGTSVVLEADSFPGGHLDWYSFSVGTGKVTSAPQQPAYTGINFLPAHVTFRGMPGDRWWNFEDSVTDFGQLDSEPVDLAQMLVMEFALVYGADWFFVPVPSAVGVLETINTLVVTDTFGARTLIRPVEQLPVVSGSRPWSMFKITSGTSVSDFILLAPALGVTDDAAPLENVLFLRDNMAALAWAVERTLDGSLDLPVDGYEQYLARVRLDLLGQPPAPTASGPGISYTLQYPVPDNWIPMIPVLSADGTLLLRRGTMDIPGPDGTVIQLQPHSSILTPGTPFYLNDRTISPAGVAVRKYFRRTRSSDGTTIAWAGRATIPGSGPGWSGLKFDFLRNADGDGAQ
jgi:hypothetical protein